METRWNRLENLISPSSVAKLKKKNVLIVGLGGVGGYVAEALARCGVGNFTLVDKDKVTESNMNRQIVALTSTIGLDKTELMKKRIEDINPEAQVRSRVLYLDENNLSQIFDENYDYVIDACDTIKTKQLLIDYCFNKNIALIASMGTARKKDPQKLEIIEIRKTSYDPLARNIRKYVLKNHKNKKLYVLSSTENPQKIMDKNLASAIFVPATAGLLIAHFVVEKWIS